MRPTHHRSHTSGKLLPPNLFPLYVPQSPTLDKDADPANSIPTSESQGSILSAFRSLASVCTPGLVPFCSAQEKEDFHDLASSGLLFALCTRSPGLV